MAVGGSRSSAWRLTKRMWREIQEDQIFDTAAGVAFWLLLSLPAAALAMLSSLSVLGDDAAKAIQDPIDDFVERTFTTESATIRNAVDGIFDLNRPGLLSVAVLVAIFTLSRGFAGLIRALDIAYDVDEGRRFIRLRATAIGLAVGSIIVFAAATSLWLALTDAGVPGAVQTVLALLILIWWASVVFHIGPHLATPWRYALPGAVFAAAGWFVVSFGFGFYVSVASSGNEIVGAAGAALLALTWLWLMCLVLLIGAELNQILAERADVITAPREFGVDVRGRVEDQWRRRRTGS